MKLTDISVIRDLLGENQTSFKKKYGQNFLVNDGIVKKIVDGCGASDSCGILEIGPGIGVLTSPLSERAKKVVALEIDPDMVEILKKTVGDRPNVTVLCQDVLKTDLKTLLESEFSDCSEVRVCANLPYYITTPIITSLLGSGLPFRSLTVMVQKEVADRLVAPAGSDDYGAISVFVAYYGHPYKVASVSSGSFIPAPKVDSTVLRVDIYPESERPVRPDDEKTFFSLVRAAFMQRRKTLANSLFSVLSQKYPDMTKDDLASFICSAGLKPNVRGEELSVSDFARLSDIVSKNLGV